MQVKVLVVQCLREALKKNIYTRADDRRPSRRRFAIACEIPSQDTYGSDHDSNGHWNYDGDRPGTYDIPQFHKPHT
jgi:hypothetical protein